MSFKICHNNEIHKISSVPSTLLDLHKKINSIFHHSLPENYHLEYLDSDGDRIVISNDYGYKEFIQTELPSASKPLKVYVTFFDQGKNRQRGGLPAAEKEKQKQPSAPIHIQNKEQFAKELRHPDQRAQASRQKREDAPSNESLPSSSDDHEEKVHEIYETVEDLKKQGKVDLQPKIYADPESDKELKKREKKDKKDKKVEDDAGEEKTQKKLGKLLAKIREKELPEEKKEKVVKKLMKYKESLASKQKDKAEKAPMQQRERETQSRSAQQQRNPLELVVTQVLQSMIPELTRLTGEQINMPLMNQGSNRQSETSKVTHPRIICDGCSMRPITGVRYKCTLCPNFDYCENCEETMGHPHPFIKIRTPEQDYFSYGLFYDNFNTGRRQNAPRVASGSNRPQQELFEQEYGPIWAARVSSLGEDTSGQTRQKLHNVGSRNAPTSKFGKEKHYGYRHRGQTRRNEQNLEREKENVFSSNAGLSTNRSNEVEIEDETFLFREKVLKEAKELRERQNQEWVLGDSSEDDLVDLEKGKKKETPREHLGDVKSKASKLKKEFPNVKFDTLIRFVEEAPEDLTTDELVHSFLSWK